MGKAVKRHIRTREEWEAILRERFSYLPQDELEKLLKGDVFVKVPILPFSSMVLGMGGGV